MGEFENEHLPAAQETLLKEYLSDELDRQAGRAEASFRQFLAPEAGDEESGLPLFRLPQGFGGWSMSLIGAALAASLAALWAGPSLRPLAAPTPVAQPGNGGASLVNNPAVVQQDMQSQTFDAGTFMLDRDTPVRVIRRHDVERTRWFDQNQQLEGEQTVPEDHVIYVPIKAY